MTTRVLILADPDDGTVTAYFPDEPYSRSKRGFVSCYAHIGQHGGADLAVCLAREVEASEDGAAPLLRELKRQGYSDLEQVSVADYLHEKGVP